MSFPMPGSSSQLYNHLPMLTLSLVCLIIFHLFCSPYMMIVRFVYLHIMVRNSDIAKCVPEVIPAEGHHIVNIKHKATKAQRHERTSMVKHSETFVP